MDSPHILRTSVKLHVRHRSIDRPRSTTRIAHKRNFFLHLPHINITVRCWAAHKPQCLYSPSPSSPHAIPQNSILTPALQAYHSVFLDEPNQHLIGNFALLPLRTRTRGPALQLPPLPAGASDLDIDASHESYDPLDEVLSLFRANTFFRNFEIKGPADRVLIYGILFVQEILGKVKSSACHRSVYNKGVGLC